MVAWGPIADTAYPGEPGGIPATITDDYGGLTQPGATLPESAVEVIEPDGTHVAWLPQAKTWQWRRSKSDPGSGRVTVARSDPIVDELAFPRQLRFFDRGVIRQRALIEPIDSNTVDQGEEAAEDITIAGPGPLALTARMRLDPIRLDLKPKQGAVRFNFAHPDFLEYSSLVWEPVSDVGTYDVPTDWPGGGSSTNITGPSGDHDFAPGGTYYLRAPASFTLAADTDVALIMTADNVGRSHLNGPEVLTLDTFDSNNYLTRHEIRERLSAGDHFLAASMFNQSSDAPGPLGNPGSVRIELREIDANGQLGDVIYQSTADWIAYEFLQSRDPDRPRPGWTAGGIMMWCFDKVEARTSTVVTLTYDYDVDTDGADWAVIDDFTGNVGSLFDFLQALQESGCDLDWAADSDSLSAWNKDTRGTARDVDLPAGYGDTETGCLANLHHQVEAPLLTSALVEWRDGYELVDTPSDAPVERKIDAPLVDSASAARRIGTAALAAFGVERVQGTAALVPRSDAQRPGLGFDVADTMNLPNRVLELVPQVVQAYTHSVNRNGEIAWDLEFGDLLYDREQRFGTWLKGISNGSLGGRTFQTTQYRHEAPPLPAPRHREPVIFDHDSADATGVSHPHAVDEYQTIQAVVIAIPGGEGGSFELLVNGASSGWAETVAAATTVAPYRQLSIKVVPGDIITIDCPDSITYVVGVYVT